jgi:hypothetical protein
MYPTFARTLEHHQRAPDFHTRCDAEYARVCLCVSVCLCLCMEKAVGGCSVVQKKVFCCFPLCFPKRTVALGLALCVLLTAPPRGALRSHAAGAPRPFVSFRNVPVAFGWTLINLSPGSSVPPHNHPPLPPFLFLSSQAQSRISRLESKHAAGCEVGRCYKQRERDLR